MKSICSASDHSFVILLLKLTWVIEKSTWNISPPKENAKTASRTRHGLLGLKKMHSILPCFLVQRADRRWRPFTDLIIVVIIVVIIIVVIIIVFIIIVVIIIVVIIIVVMSSISVESAICNRYVHQYITRGDHEN